jgi:hypothetical protein
LVVGFLCSLVLLWKRSWLGIALFGVVATSILYALLTKKMPYPRTWGPFYPLFLLAIASVWHLVRGAVVRKAVLTSTALATLWLGFEFFQPQTAFAPHYTTLSAETRKTLGNPVPDRTMIWMPWVWDVRFYLPADDKFFTLPEPLAGKAHMVFLSEERDSTTVHRVAYWDPLVEEFLFWPIPKELNCSKVAEAGKFKTLAADVELQAVEPGTKPPESFVMLCVETKSEWSLMRIVHRISELSADYKSWRILPQKGGNNLVIAVVPAENFPKAQVIEAAEKIRGALGGTIVAVLPAPLVSETAPVPVPAP